MNRLSQFFLLATFAVTGSGLLYYGWNQKTRIEPIETNQTWAVADLLSESPEESTTFCLTDFKPGKYYVPYDEDEDGKWEQVVVPMFPSQLNKLGKNYNAVLCHFGDVENFDELKQRLESPSIPVRFRADGKEVDGFTYNELAKRYTSMNFDKNVSVFTGYPAGGDVADLILAGGGFSLLVAFLFGAWQTVELISGNGPEGEVPGSEFDNIEIVSTGEPELVPVDQVEVVSS